MGGVRARLAEIGGAVAGQVGGLLLAPGSTFSIAALLASLALFVALVLRGKRKRALRFRVLRRALFPNRLVATASGRVDLCYFLAGIAFLGAAVGWTVIASGDIRRGVAGTIGGAGAPLLPGWAAATLATLAAFLAYEFAYYVDHWLKHRVAILWHFHKVHHQAESLSLLTNGRIHPVDTMIFHNIVAVTMGATAAVSERMLGNGGAPFTVGGTNLLVMVTAVSLTHLQHSHLWLTFGPRWGRWLLGPAHHQIHHSAADQHHDRNLGNTLAVFDRAFGTFFVPAERREALRFGVDDAERAPHSLRAATIQPFVDTARAIGRVVRDTSRRARYRATWSRASSS